MNLAYVAANYFIEVIFRSPNCTINFDNLKMFRKLIAREVCPAVAEYLDKESQEDFLFIFRKFPDIFSLKPDTITFTDTFTFLHNHLDSYEFYFNGACDIRTVLYLENFAVSYFSKCLKSLGPQHYLSLFTMIVDKTSPFSLYFQLHNALDAQIFFEAHADVFLLYNNIVSLRKEKLLLTNPLLSKTLAPNIMMLFEDSVYFLLTCFKSLHYIELRQCICYAFTSVKNIFNRFPVIKQREVFEILPHLNMTELGYLSLKYMEVNISITSLDKTLLFIVCLLAFQKTMHFKDIEKEINHRLPSTSNCLKGFTKTALVQFFSNLSELFKMSEGCVTLLPTFIFPVFTTEICIPQNDNDASNPVDMSRSHHTSSTSEIANPDAKTLNAKKSLQLQLQVAPALQNDNLSSIDNNCKYFLYTLMLSESNNKQIRLSILFLRKYFHPVDKQCVLITLFYVMEKVYNAFCNLSTSDRRLFILHCCQFINALSEHVSEECITATMFEFEGIEKEILLLFIAYPLTSQKEIHFQKIMKSLEEKKINNPILSLSVSEQYKYFQEMKKYLKMGKDGYVSLTQPFDLIKEDVDIYTGFLSEKCCMDNSKMLKCPRRKEKVSEAEISVTVSEILHRSSPVTAHKVPLDVRKTLLTAHHLCKKHIPHACLRRIFAISVFILQDLRKYVYNLSVNEQNNFVKECYQFMCKVRSFKKALREDVFCVMDISNEERDNMLIAYFLSGRTNNHIHGIIDKLKKYSLCKSLTTLTNYEDQFKYFEEASQYFIISCDGYVTLHPSFDHLNAISLTGFSTKQRIRGRARCLKENPIKYQIKHIKMPVENNRVINSPSSETILVNTDNDVERKSAVIDMSIFILSSTNQIPVEKLCHRVNTCKVPTIEDFFSLFTAYEKAKFFKDLSEYFEVSPDNFVSLKENVIDLYVPKTNVDHLGVGNSDYEEMNERSSSTSDSALFSDVSEFSEPSSASSNNLHGKKKLPGVRKKSQSITNKEKNAAKDGKEKKDFISMPHSLNNNIVESKIIWNSSIKQDPLRNVPASNSKPDVPKNALKSEKSADISKASKSIAVNSEQPSKKIDLSQKICNAEDIYSISFVSNIASGSSNLPVSSVFNGTSDSSTKSTSEINSVCYMQNYNFSKTERTKISKAESKLDYEAIHVSKQMSSHQTVSCHKKLSPQSEENYSEFDQDHANSISNWVMKSSEENSEYCSMSNNKSNPSNKISISVKGTKDLSLNASSSEVPSKPKHPEDLSTEIASNINSDPIYNNAKVRMPSQKSRLAINLPTRTESNKTFKNEQSTKSCFPSIHTCNKLIVQNNYNFSNDGVSYSSSVECYTSNHIVDPKKSSGELCTNFPKISSSEESKYLLESPNISSCDTAAKYDCQIAKAVKSNSAGSKSQYSNYRENYSNVPEQSKIELKQSNCDSIQETRAVNFFCVILGNYQKYNSGISAEFLKKHLHQATDEVRSVIRDNYENDFLSFFKKHKNEFYVSPQSQDIYLQRK